MSINCPTCGKKLAAPTSMGGHARHCNVTIEQRFWLKVDKSGGPDACWPWTGARVPAGGYGRFLAERVIAAHRYAWILHNGPIESKEIDVMHTCDNPPCCNPKHLKLGTALDNMRDCIAKGRNGNGSKPLDKLILPHMSRRLQRA